MIEFSEAEVPFRDDVDPTSVFDWAPLEPVPVQPHVVVVHVKKGQDDAYGPFMSRARADAFAATHKRADVLPCVTPAPPHEDQWLFMQHVAVVLDAWVASTLLSLAEAVGQKTFFSAPMPPEVAMAAQGLGIEVTSRMAADTVKAIIVAMVLSGPKRMQDLVLQAVDAHVLTPDPDPPKA